jgi:low temperature requirement protein LtrA
MAMWWKYFDPAEAAQEHLQEHDDPVIAAADGYSYMHLVIVAGVIIFAAGAKLLVAEPIQQSLPTAARLALCGGVAIYLLGHFAFLLRLTGEPHYESLFVAAALLLLYSISAGIPGWTTAAIVLLLTGGLCAVEIARERRRSRGHVEPAAVADESPGTDSSTGSEHQQVSAAPHT